MLKIAFEKGVKLAFTDAGLTPEQMAAAQRLTGIGGGLTGAGLGGLLGRYLGGHAAESFDLDPQISKYLGTGLGALLGGGLGAYAGTQVPKWKFPTQRPQQEESALGLLPASEYVGAFPEYNYLGMMQDYEPDYGYNYGY